MNFWSNFPAFSFCYLTKQEKAVRKKGGKKLDKRETKTFVLRAEYFVDKLSQKYSNQDKGFTFFFYITFLLSFFSSSLSSFFSCSVVLYNRLLSFQLWVTKVKMFCHRGLESTVIERRQQQLGRMADFQPPITFSVFYL